MEVLVALIVVRLGMLVVKAVCLYVINEQGMRKSVERRKEYREAVLSRLDYAVVERRTGYPVPQTLRDFHASPVFLELDGFSFRENPDSEEEARFSKLECFLPLNEEMLNQCNLPDSTWLPFALDDEGGILFLPLSEFYEGDGPVYRIVQGTSPWEQVRREQMRRVSDSLRNVLEQGARATVQE